jgi:hypothetical protein
MLEKVVEELDNKKFVYKFLSAESSEDKWKTIQNYNLNVLTDCLMFSGYVSRIRSDKVSAKTGINEKTILWRNIITQIFNDERHVAIINDYYDNTNMVLVMPLTLFDTSGRKPSTLDEIDENVLIDVFINELRNREGVNAVSWDEYSSDFYVEKSHDKFIEKQKEIKEDHEKKVKQEILATFIEAYKFRMITYYTKLRSFGLDEIMRKLYELGYLDERFNDEVYIYEEEARRLLAKRLCAISYKNDIKLLIEEGILNPDRVPYNLDL